MDANLLTQIILRWIHVVAGVMWIGLLYFFNFINANFVKTLDADTKRKVVPELMPRALFFFRWGAMVTWASGWIYIFHKIFIMSDGGFTGSGGLLTSVWGQWITMGAIFGTVMWFNVWFIIWPAQKKIIGWVRAGQAPPEMAGLAARAALASKINTYLSVPLIFFMGAASHFPIMHPLWMLGAIVVGLGVAHHIYKVGSKLGSES